MKDWPAWAEFEDREAIETSFGLFTVRVNGKEVSFKHKVKNEMLAGVLQVPVHRVEVDLRRLEVGNRVTAGIAGCDFEYVGGDEHADTLVYQDRSKAVGLAGSTNSFEYGDPDYCYEAYGWEPYGWRFDICRSPMSFLGNFRPATTIYLDLCDVDKLEYESLVGNVESAGFELDLDYQLDLLLSW